MGVDLQADVGGQAALEAAATLAEAGRLVDAVQLLAAADRRARDAAVEERLVELRHLAFETLALEAPADAMPPVTAEPVPAGPLPELGPDDLTPEVLRRGIARHGCVLVRGLIGPDRVDTLVEGIDRALDACDAGLAGAPRRDTTPWYAPFTPTDGRYRVGGRRNWVRASGGVWTADSPRMLAELLELLDDTGIGELVTAYLGERPTLSANKCTLRRVPVDSNTSWHQDGAFLGTEVRTINLWLGLTTCGEGTDAPGLDIVPRRFDGLVDAGTEGAMFDWSVADAVVDRVADGAPVVRPRFEAGDALLFDHLFLHRTATGPAMTRERHAIETWMFAPSSYPGGQIPIVY